MSRRLEEMKLDLNYHLLEVLNSAIAEKTLPSLKNAIAGTQEAKNAKQDLQSDGRHANRAVQTTHKLDPMAYGLYKSKLDQQKQNLGKDLPRLITTSSNQNDH